MEQGTGLNGPAGRLLRLWLWGSPLVMLTVAVLFGVLAVGEEEWGLLAAMVIVALTSVGLFVVQWRLLRRISAGSERS
jgi:hypothetical protein